MDPHQLRSVRSLRWWRPKLETISETASPAPWRRACRRTNQLPIPASGASRTRLAISHPADLENGSESRAGLAGPASSERVALVDQLQARQGEQVVDLARSSRRRGRSRRRSPPVATNLRRLAQLRLAAGGRSRRSPRRTRRPSPPGGWPGWCGRSRRSARPGRPWAAARRARSAPPSRSATPGPITPPRYSPSSETASKVIAGAEVDDGAGAAEAVVGGDRVDEPVGAELVRVVEADRHPGLHPRADHHAGGAQVPLGSSASTRGQPRHDRADDRGVDRAELDPAQPQQARQPRPRARRRCPRRRWRSASARPARRRRRRRCGSACCRRRSPGALGAIIG